MTELKRPEIKNALLENLYQRVREGKGDKDASASAIRKACNLVSVEISTHYVEVLLESLEQAGYVRRGSRNERFKITEHGIDLIESGWRFSAIDETIVDAWNKPDGSTILSVSSAQTVQQYLKQCIILINNSEFSQEEKAQVAGLIRICEQIVDLPTPKIGLLRRILSWLKEIKDLVPLVEAILKLLGNS